MSTDESQPLLVPKTCKTYITLPHHDSNRSARRGLVGWMLGKWGKPEFKHHTTYQFIKHPGGEPLPHQPFVSNRNKYVPHVGKKQLAKLAR